MEKVALKCSRCVLAPWHLWCVGWGMLLSLNIPISILGKDFATALSIFPLLQLSLGLSGAYLSHEEGAGVSQSQGELLLEGR